MRREKREGEWDRGKERSGLFAEVDDMMGGLEEKEVDWSWKKRRGEGAGL